MKFYKQKKIKPKMPRLSQKCPDILKSFLKDYSIYDKNNNRRMFK